MKKSKSIPLIKTRFIKLGLTKGTIDALASGDVLTELDDDAEETDIQTALDGLEPVAKMLQKAEDSARQTLIDKQKEDAKKKQQSERKKEEGGEFDEPETPNADKDTPEWAKNLFEEVKGLRTELSTIKGENTAKTRKELYRKELEGLPEDVIADKMADFDLLNFKDGEHFTTWLDGKKEGIEAIRQEHTAQAAGSFGQHQRSAGGANTKEKPSSNMTAYLESKKKPEGAIVGKNPFGETVS